MQPQVSQTLTRQWGIEFLCYCLLIAGVGLDQSLLPAHVMSGVQSPLKRDKKRTQTAVMVTTDTALPLGIVSVIGRCAAALSLQLFAKECILSLCLKARQSLSTLASTTSTGVSIWDYSPYLLVSCVFWRISFRHLLGTLQPVPHQRV